MNMISIQNISPLKEIFSLQMQNGFLKSYVLGMGVLRHCPWLIGVGYNPWVLDEYFSNQGP